MKKLVVLVFLVASVVTISWLFAGSDKPVTVTSDKAVTAEKTAWLTSFDDAKAEAAKRKVPILADFSGSDWCGWCIKLDREVFSKSEFKEYAGANLVLLMVDFPRSKEQSAEVKKQNSKLSDQYQIEGFPTVLLLDAQGKELARTGYQPGGAAAYVAHLKSLISGK